MKKEVKELLSGKFADLISRAYENLPEGEGTDLEKSHDALAGEVLKSFDKGTITLQELCDILASETLMAASYMEAYYCLKDLIIVEAQRQAAMSDEDATTRFNASTGPTGTGLN